MSVSALFAVNAGYSGITGVIAVIASRFLAETLEVPSWVVIGLGGGLVAFAITLVWLRRPSRLTAAWAWLVSVADLLWVVGMVVFVVAARPSWAGSAIVLGSAAPVLALAIAQLRARRWMTGLSG